MRPLLAALVLAVAGCVQIGGGSAAQVTGEGEVPFTLAGSGGAAIVVPVHVNGTGPYQLVVDTGATYTCLDQKLVERLELPEPVGIVGFGATAGGTGSVSLHRMKTLTVGDVTAKGLTACALNLRNVQKVGLDVDGLLGLNFLRSFKVTFDFKRKVLSLQSSS